MIGDLFDFRNNTFEVYRANTHERWRTFQMAINWFVQTGGLNIVETGCIRDKSYQDGASTRLFADLVKKVIGARFWSVDIEPRHVELARSFVPPHERIELCVGDSIEFLKAFNNRIDLLYLDSFDYNRGDPGPAQLHALKEMQVVFPNLSPKACVLIDDNDPVGGGKGELAKKFLAEHDFVCLMDHFQSCWVRV